MERLEQVRQELIEFNQAVGWGNLNPQSANQLASLLIAESVELWEEIEKEKKIGISKYDVSLEIADVFIYLQKICIALDIDLLESVQDKMLINRARFLNKEYQSNVIMPKPKPNRYYKITSKYQQIETSSDFNIYCGHLLGIKTESKQLQTVYIFDEKEDAPEYIKRIIGVVYPRNEQNPVWIAADCEMTVKEIDSRLKYVDYLYDIELI